MYVRKKNPTTQHLDCYLLKVDHGAPSSDRIFYHDENIIHLCQYGCQELNVTIETLKCG